MRSVRKYLSVFVAAFAVGILAAFGWLALSSPFEAVETVTEINSHAPAAPATELPLEEEIEPKNPLDDVWQEDGSVLYNGFEIRKNCVASEMSKLYSCEITVSKNGRVLKHYENEFAYENSLKFGLFNFLGGDDKQLIVFQFSGGATCCLFYEIYDLKPTFRKIYGEIKEDAPEDVGNELFPMDLDNDGVFEFRRTVMTFHITEGARPLAIFQYDRKSGQFKNANRRFRRYIQVEFDKFVGEFIRRSHKGEGGEKTIIDPLKNLSEETIEYLNMSNLFYRIYIGERDSAWSDYDQDVQGPYKEASRKDIEQRLRADSTYRAIYR